MNPGGPLDAGQAGNTRQVPSLSRDNSATQAIRDCVLGYVEERDLVSFVELRRVLTDNGVDPEGSITLTLEEPNQNVIIWSGISRSRPWRPHRRGAGLLARSPSAKDQRS
jgi:hypothetical protein